MGDVSRFEILLTTEVCIFEKIGVNSHFGSTEGVIRYTTSTLIGRVNSMLRGISWCINPLVYISIRRIKLARREEHQIAMVESTKRQVDRSNTVHVWHRIRSLRWFPNQLRSPIIEGVVRFRCGRNRLETWVFATNDGGSGKGRY